MNISMSFISSHASDILFPNTTPKQDLSHALDAIKQQQLARIAKVAIYTLAAIATTATIVLTEAAVIAWPTALPVIIVCLAAWALFYRLNTIDSRYTAELDDQSRSAMAKQALEELFQQPYLTKEQVKQKIEEINTLLGCKAISEEYEQTIMTLLDQSDNKSIQDRAKDKGISLALASKKEWDEPGRFGLDAYHRQVEINWDGSLAATLKVTYQANKKGQ